MRAAVLTASIVAALAVLSAGWVAADDGREAPTAQVAPPVSAAPSAAVLEPTQGRFHVGDRQVVVCPGEAAGAQSAGRVSHDLVPIVKPNGAGSVVIELAWTAVNPTAEVLRFGLVEERYTDDGVFAWAEGSSPLRWVIDEPLFGSLPDEFRLFATAPECPALPVQAHDLAGQAIDFEATFGPLVAA